MAKGNMIVTLVAQTKKFQDGLSDAGKRAQTFGSVVGSAMNLALGALGLLAGALIMFLPNFIKMGEEARKSELRLGNVAKQMGLFGDETDKVTGRISKYAEELSYLTGIDDELTRENQAVLLTFSELAKSADKVGGPFDRATKALLDLEAAGKDLKAVALGKALQDPLENMTALRKAGILLTDEQEKQIEAFMAVNDIIGAQDVLLKAIEGQVGGTAEAIASSTDKMNARFESVVEELSLALLPAVDDIAEAMSAWLESPEGKKAIDDLAQSFKDFGAWITSAEGKAAVDKLIESFVVMGQVLVGIVDALTWISQWLAGPSPAKLAESAAFWESLGGSDNPVYYPPYTGPAPAVPVAPNTGAPGGPRVEINLNGVIPSSTLNRLVADAAKEGVRLGQRQP